MRHLADDMLLAYVRQQQRELWPPDLQEHLALCPVCSRKCTEFKAIGNTLEEWTHPSTVDPRYAEVSNRVLRALYEPQGAPKGQMRPDISRGQVFLPIGVVLVLLGIVLLVGLGVNIASNVAKSNKVRLSPTVVMHTPTVAPIKPTPTLGPIPTVTSAPVVTATVAVPGIGGPTATPVPKSVAYIKVNTPCTTAIDILQNELRVCGHHFTPYATVTIYYQIGSQTKKHSAQVAADGTFNDMLYIQDCSHVPGSIFVQNVTNPTETALLDKDITFGTCLGFGKFKKPK